MFANAIIPIAINEEKPMSVKEISRATLSEALLSKHPPVVLEALDRKYYDDGHIPTARLLPPAEIDRAPAIVADKDQAIVLYCASATCRNSHQAAAHLERQGYRNVAVYSGGKADWVGAGLRLEK
jgi:rhodanese-related sulfurtransferase